MRIAIISDIHSNLEALKTTLEDIKKRNVDKIICLGDTIAKGVHPRECIDLVKKNCDIVLTGNCDGHFAREFTKEDFNKLSDINKKRLIWNQSLITSEDRKYLLSLPYSYEFYMSGSLIRLFHASPTNYKAIIINEDSIDTKYKMFLPSENTVSDKIADIVIYGHIHHQFLSTLYNKTLINVGSVGNSFETIRNEDKDGNIMEATKINYLIIGNCETKLKQ